MLLELDDDGAVEEEDGLEELELGVMLELEEESGDEELVVLEEGLDGVWLLELEGFQGVSEELELMGGVLEELLVLDEEVELEEVELLLVFDELVDGELEEDGLFEEELFDEEELLMLRVPNLP